MAIDPSAALIPLADAKAYLKITAASDDGIIGDLINQTSEFVGTYVGRKFLQATYSEYYDGGRDHLVLNQYPVTEVASIHDDPLRVFAAGSLIDPVNYFVDGGAGIIRCFMGRVRFMEGFGNVKVAYTAGYPVANIPYDVQLAVRLIVAQQYKHRYVNQRFGVSSETIGDRTVAFSDVAMPAEAKEILEHHKGVSAFGRGF